MTPHIGWFSEMLDPKCEDQPHDRLHWPTCVNTLLGIAGLASPMGDATTCRKLHSPPTNQGNLQINGTSSAPTAPAGYIRLDLDGCLLIR
jgi:hypothetical protein